MLARLVRCAVIALALAAAVPLSTAETSSGTVHTGVGSEAEARGFPCAGDTGPVVCVPDEGGEWRLSSEATGDCSQGVMGWYGDCVFAFDDGELLRVWGTRGIPPRSFRITWLAEDTDAKEEDSQDQADPAPRTEGTQEQRQAAPDPAASTREPVVARVTPPAATRVTTTPSAPRDQEPSSVPEPIVGGPGQRVPPVTEVPGYSALPTPAPMQPTFPTAAGRLTPKDAGAPAAAGVVALLAAGWVVRLERRAARDGGDAH